MHIGSFLEVNVQNGDIFGVAKISNLFWGMPDIPYIYIYYIYIYFFFFFFFFLGGGGDGKQWMLGPSLRMKKNESTPLPPPGA